METAHIEPFPLVWIMMEILIWLHRTCWINCLEEMKKLNGQVWRFWLLELNRKEYRFGAWEVNKERTKYHEEDDGRSKLGVEE